MAGKKEGSVDSYLSWTWVSSRLVNILSWWWYDIRQILWTGRCTGETMLHDRMYSNYPLLSITSSCQLLYTKSRNKGKNPFHRIAFLNSKFLCFCSSFVCFWLDLVWLFLLLFFVAAYRCCWFFSLLTWFSLFFCYWFEFWIQTFPLRRALSMHACLAHEHSGHSSRGISHFDWLWLQWMKPTASRVSPKHYLLTGVAVPDLDTNNPLEQEWRILAS